MDCGKGAISAPSLKGVGAEMANRLFYGDNLGVLRGQDADGRSLIANESVDLIYLDPPFNSATNYNVLFRAPDGTQSASQLEAFEDTWRWGDEAEAAYNEVLTQTSHTDASVLMRGIVTALGRCDMTAYLVNMAVRLIELHKILKINGSIYLHCDPTASHYLKIVLDGIFSPENFRSEIIWRRTGSHNKMKRWAPIHDTILFYSKSKDYTWNYPRRPYMMGHVKDYFVEDGQAGYRTNYFGNVLTGSGTRGGESGQTWQGFDPTARGRHWAIPGKIWDEVGVDPTGLSQHQKLDLLLQLGFIKIRPGEIWPIYEHSIRKEAGPAATDIWAFQPYTEGTVFGSREGIDHDVRWLSPRDQERLGYPTQKPLALLERIIQASSNPGDVVLDPFCGCGTAVHAAEKLGRQWIGIDVTHLAISLIERRLKDAFPAIKFDVLGTPKDLAGAEDLARRDKYQFQWWVVSLLDAVPQGGKRKGADRGIDGIRWVRTGPNTGDLDRIIVSVKGGQNIGVKDVKDLIATVAREQALGGVLITLASPTRPMLTEAASAGMASTGLGQFRKITVVTVPELLAGTHRATLPPLGRQEGFRRAAREKPATGEQAGLDF
jgi:DNA modification methylase